MEFGLMSTTTARETALAYSGKDGERCTVFEIAVGRVDVGADIGFLSQYPGEREFLMQPLSCLEVPPRSLSPRRFPPTSVALPELRTPPMPPLSNPFCCPLSSSAPSSLISHIHGEGAWQVVGEPRIDRSEQGEVRERENRERGGRERGRGREGDRESGRIEGVD